MGFEPTDTDFAGQRVSHFATGAIQLLGLHNENECDRSSRRTYLSRILRPSHILNYYGIFARGLNSWTIVRAIFSMGESRPGHGIDFPPNAWTGSPV